MIKLNQTECALVKYLATQKESLSELCIESISDQLDISKSTAKKAIRRLEKEGILAGYLSIIHPCFIEQATKESPPIRAFVELSVQPQKSTGYDTIAKRIYKYPQVIEHYLLSGSYEFLVVVEAKNHLDIASFVSDKLATIEQVTGTVTHFCFKCYKTQGIPLQTEENSDRLAIMA